MPIRLNLLAEAQAAEELRRKDPVKRAIWGAAVVICLMLVWSSSVQLKTMMSKRELAKSMNQMQSFTNDYGVVLENKRKADEVRNKIAKLQLLTQSRFLQANVLNAMQQTTVDDVQLMRLRTELGYAFTEGVKPKTNDSRVIPGKPATVTERIAVSLDGSDSALTPGDQVTKYKEVLANNSYFKEMLGGKPNAVSLKTISAPESSATTGRKSVSFTLECRYPEKLR